MPMYDDDDELTPMIPKESSSAYYCEEPSQILNNNMDTNTHSQNGFQRMGIDVNDIKAQVETEKDIEEDLSHMGEYIKITSNIYVGTCATISVKFLKSIGFNHIINIDSEELLLDVNDYTHICVTPENLNKRSTQQIIEDDINKGLLSPKVLINFSDLNTMIVVTSFYMLKNKIEGSNFMDIYELGNLPREYIGIVNELIPNIHQFNKENDILRLHEMFPDMDINKLEKAYKDYHGIMEEIINSLFI